jgi:hypothetical protein
MSDLQDLRLALREREVEPLGAHAIAQIMKDGGRMRRRRRLIAGATVTGSALSLALVAGLITVTAAGGDGYVIVPATTVTTTAPPTPSSTPTGPTTKTSLVSYLGKPLVQFGLERSPRGWVVQGDGTRTLTLAPKNAADKNPYTFVGKLVVTVDTLPMETSSPKGSTLVADQPPYGRLTLSADGMQTFTYPLTGKRRAVISIPAELGWGSAEIVAFANGVAVHDDVQLSLG